MPELTDIELNINKKNVITRLKKFYGYEVEDSFIESSFNIEKNSDNNLEKSKNNGKTIIDKNTQSVNKNNKYAKLDNDSKKAKINKKTSTINNLKEKTNKENSINLKSSKKIINSRIINKEIKKATKLLKPYIIYKDFDIKVENNIITLKNSFIIKSKDLAKIVKDSKKATLVALTIGDNFNNTKEILDAIGSEATETLANYFTKHMIKRLKPLGYKPLFRYGCGYGDWQLQDQAKILKALGTKKIKPLDSGFVTPQKSVTALVGWKKIKD